MTNYVLDTNILVSIVRQELFVSANFELAATSQNTFYGCPVVWYEARRGLLFKDAHSRMARMMKLFSTFTWNEYTKVDWQLAAEWWADRYRLGKPVGDADLLIAVYAYNRNSIIVTDNEKDFSDLSVTVENWKRQ